MNAMEPHLPDGEVVDLHERAEAALGWVDEDASNVGSASPAWAAQSCEELAPASQTGRLLDSAR
jgi:hypothetical protein